MSFPQGPYSAAYALSVEAWMHIEREQYDEAEAGISQLTDIAAQHGFDGWMMVATTQQTLLAGIRALTGGADVKDIALHASVLFEMTEIWKRFDTRFFLPYYLMVAGVLYAGAGDKRMAQTCLEDSLRLAAETGMQFWQSETQRHLAHLELHPAGREEKLRAALLMARSQRAALFELRAALDLADLDRRHIEEVDRALDHLGRDSAYPEVARAQAVLGTVAVRRGRQRVAVLGGGMAGLTAAWRLSEPGWEENFERITVYQRGWRLGGKGASSRGPNGRIEEHGLHVWLGWYENAFRLLRECYDELDRPTTRPDAPVKSLSDAMFPSTQIGLCERTGGPVAALGGRSARQ